MIEVNRLVKKYGNKTAVNDISFQIQEGEIVGFLGPNGAGKSTTMNILTGYISATSGSVKIGGIDVLEDPIGAKKKIGYLPEQPPLYLDMTVEEQLNFAYELKGIKMADKAGHIRAVCELVRINDVRKRMIKNLSKGYKQRVGFAQALLGNPDVLILDEPTVGLDPKQIIEIRTLIGDLGKHHTIILSSHILSEISAVCKRVLVINKGSIVADGDPEVLSREMTGEKRMLLRVEGPEADVRPILQNIPGVISCQTMGSKEEGTVDYMVENETNADIRRQLFYELASKGYAILMMKPMELSLEEIFLHLTKESNKASEKTPEVIERMEQTLVAPPKKEEAPKETQKEEQSPLTENPQQVGEDAHMAQELEEEEEENTAVMPDQMGSESLELPPELTMEGGFDTPEEPEELPKEEEEE